MKRIMQAFLFAASLAALATAVVPSAHAQTLLFTLQTTNPPPGNHFGYSVAVGDVSGDGKEDIAVGAPFEDVGGNANQGRAYAFSGAAYTHRPDK